MEKLIVIEGLDGSGKKTQAKILYKNLKKNMYNSKLISFPDYQNKSSSLIKMYLNGEFGSSPKDVNAYAASSFYAVDRYASFKKNWQNDYNSGTVIVCDRYTTSNAIYQLTKLPKDEWNNYLKWLHDYEYSKLGLPIPNIVIFLKIDVEISQKLMEKRYHGDSSKKDLHESNINFLKKCQEISEYVCEKCRWKIINCTKNGLIRNKDDIANEILKLIVK